MRRTEEGGEISWPRGRVRNRRNLRLEVSATKCMSADSVRTRHLAVYSNESRGWDVRQGMKKGRRP